MAYIADFHLLAIWPPSPPVWLGYHETNSVLYAHSKRCQMDFLDTYYAQAHSPLAYEFYI